MSASFCEILNSQINSLAKNKQITDDLLLKTIENALSENAVDFNEEEDVSMEIIVFRKLYGSIAVERFNHCNTCADITRHFEKSSFISSDIIIRVINELFDHYRSSWEYVVCLFVLIDILVWKEGIMAQDGEYENYRANVNSKIATPISETFAGTVAIWVFFNGGWAAFLNQYNFTLSSSYDQTVKCGEILQQMRDFIVNL